MVILSFFGFCKDGTSWMCSQDWSTFDLGKSWEMRRGFVQKQPCYLEPYPCKDGRITFERKSYRDEVWKERRSTQSKERMDKSLKWANFPGKRGFRGFSAIKYPMKMNNLVSVRPNYFIFMGYFWIFIINEIKPTSFIHMNPRSRNPWSAPASGCLPGKFAHLNDSNTRVLALWFSALS